VSEADDDDIFHRLAGVPHHSAAPVSRVKELARRELPKRFYKDVTVEPGPEGHKILLDGRSVRTPRRNLLAVPEARLAEGLAAEWAAQGDLIDPATMPLTRLVNTALDGIPEVASDVADDIAKFAGSDLLTYRADGPERLVRRQRERWDPVLTWAEARFNVRFRLAEGVMPIAQDAAVLPAVRAALEGRSALDLAGLHTLTTLTGSVLLALAVAEGALDPEAGWAAAHLDEDWNIELWGEDFEAARRRAARKAEYDAALILLGLLR